MSLQDYASYQESDYLEGQTIWTLGRAVGFDGTVLDDQTSGSTGVVNYDVNIFDESGDDPGTAVWSLSNGTTGDVMFSALQTGAPWIKDQTGYNFLLAIHPEGSNTETAGDGSGVWRHIGGHTYRIELALNTDEHGLVLHVHRVNLHRLSTLVEDLN